MRDKEAELAKYFQAHRDDQEEWSEQAEESSVKKPASVVYSVRFSPAELTELRRIAADRQVPLSELIRTSAIRHVREPDSSNVDVSAIRVKFFSQLSFARAGTRGSPPPNKARIEFPGRAAVGSA